MEGLGRLFDLSAGIVPVDLAGGAATGKRVHLRDASAVSIVIYKAAGTATENSTVTLQEHTAASGGTSTNLAAVDHYYAKTEASLDGDEVWVRVDNTSGGAAQATITLTGGSEQLIVIPLDASALSDGYGWVSVNTSDLTTAGALGAVLYALHDLTVQRDATALVAPQ